MRHAIYFTPGSDDPLTLAANSWLGRNAFTGVRSAMPAAPGLSAQELHAITAEPRRYGFHGTLVAPFRLRDGLSPAALQHAATEFALRRTAFVIQRMSVARIGGFFALTPDESIHVDALASAAVDHFDGCRAPLSATEIERRRPDRLSERQRSYLDRYGYPYVKDEFRFHMTLTGALESEEAARIEPALREHFAPLLHRPLEIAAIAIFVESTPGADFIVHSIHRFGAAEAGKSA
jgi:putative phosphonate metabolism protein